MRAGLRPCGGGYPDGQILASRPGSARLLFQRTGLAGPEDRETYWARFTQLWALKECHVKHSGAGLRQPIAQIQVPLPEGAQGLYRLDGLWFRLYPGEGWQGAVCGLVPPPEEIRWVAPPFPVQPRPG